MGVRGLLQRLRQSLAATREQSDDLLVPLHAGERELRDLRQQGAHLVRLAPHEPEVELADLRKRERELPPEPRADREREHLLAGEPPPAVFGGPLGAEHAAPLLPVVELPVGQAGDPQEIARPK